MEIIKGAYSEAHIFTTNNSATALDQYAAAQLQMICDNESSKGCLIKVMPDVHPDKVGTIGLTMTIGERIMPNLIGIDIGCGMTLAQIKGKKVEGQKLDTVIRDSVPSAFNIRKKPHRFSDVFVFSVLKCASHIRTDKARLSLGTLGGGNHFIEIDKDKVETGVRLTHIPTGITVTSNAERAQQLNRQDALRKLNAILSAIEAENRAKQTNDAWREHTRIVRGNPVRIYKGLGFTKTR